MNNQITTFQYQTNSGTKLWGFRFEMASVNGKRRWCNKRGFKTKGEALSKGKEMQFQYESKGNIIQPSEMSYSDFLDKWIESLSGVLKQSTVENYRKKSRLYLKPILGAKKLNSISKEDVKNLMIELTNGGAIIKTALAKNTITVIKGMIQKSFTYALEEHLLNENPITGKFPMPVNDYSEKRITKENPHVYIPKEKMQEIFNRFPKGSSAYLPLMIGYRCGLRIGEVYALTWEDIDFENKTLTVNRQVQWESYHKPDSNNPNKRIPKNKQTDYGFWYFTNPKYNSFRTITLDDELLNLLTEIKKQQDKERLFYEEYYFLYYQDSNGKITRENTGNEIHFINVRQNGEYINSRTMQHTSRIIHEQLEFREFDFHSLRHTHATMLVENGATPMYVQNRLGHKTLSVTINVYFHYTEKIENEGSKILSEMF